MLEEDKIEKRGKVFNWETAKYGRIWHDEDIHALRSVENKFPAIAFNDSLKSGETLSCEPTFHNSIMKDKMVYKGNNVVGALMNVTIFVGTFSVVTNFVVLKDMDAYRDKGMGDVIFGKPFLGEVGIKARRFKHHTNKQCKKIPPLLKVSDEDKKNEISHPYQKLKGFYKGVLNLGPDYIRDAKTEEWLPRGHISMHEMEW
ncbi:hypothetical protein Tco_0931505 [Tanacetum coccineum]